MRNSSPQGRIFQVEYASEAVKQGSVVVGIVSKTHAVLVALKVLPSPSSLPPNLHQLLMVILSAQRRRALLLPKENHRHRRAPGSLVGRLSIRRPSPLQLHEATVTLQPPHLRPCYSSRTPCLLHRRSCTNQHSTLRQASLWRWTVGSRR
jgi:hypothetical protein